ncbi:MAG TPA: DoxX family protein [Humibacillus sp.]|nr:DoxX family protein [Humibacillus sp.]
MSQLTLDRPGTDVTSSQPTGVLATVDHALRLLQSLLNRFSIGFLRISLGLVFLGFGVLKFFPGLSPAEDIAAATIDRLTFGLIGGHNAVLMTAILETFIGLTLVTGKFVRVGLVVLAGAFVGILSPLVLFTDELFPHGPSLLGQYVLKDIVLVAAALVVAAVALGSRLRSDSDS